MTRHAVAHRLLWPACLILSSLVHAEDLAAARAEFQQYRIERADLEKLYAQGAADSDRHDLVTRQQNRVLDTLREARTLFQRADAGRRPGNDAFDEYIEVLDQLQDYDLAAEALEEAVNAAPENAAYCARYGEYLAKAGPAKRLEAVQALRRALELDSVSETAAKTWYLLGDLYHREALSAFARECYEKSLAIMPGGIQARIAVAALDTREGRILEASREIDALGVAAQPYDAETRILLRRALADFQAARRVIPDQYEHHIAYARILYRAARFSEAILAARRATQLEPDDYATWNLIALWNGQVGNYPGAREAFQRSLEANPDQPNVRRGLESLPENPPQDQAQQ